MLQDRLNVEGVAYSWWSVGGALICLSCVLITPEFVNGEMTAVSSSMALLDLRLPSQPQSVIVYWSLYNYTAHWLEYRSVNNLPRVAIYAAAFVTKKVELVHTQLQRVWFRSWSRFLAVSLRVTWVINPAVGCHYFKRAATNFAASWTEAQWVWTVCIRLLPDSVATAIWTQALLCLSPARKPLGYRAILVSNKAV